jgi:ribosomal protein S18 acetylase RimI-like enzyme
VSAALQIATMSGADVGFAVDLAAAEGWNPGLDDAAAFRAADPGGFLIGRVDGRPVGCISAVSYAGRFGFIGLYIVVPAWRGKGCGIALWRAGMARLAGHNVGLDGVLAQQDNYRRSGFRMAYSNLRFERAGPLPAVDMRGIVSADDVPFAQLHDYDRRMFAADRESFLRGWLAQADGAALAFVADGAMRGYGVIRRCRRGFKIGPLFADGPEVAERLYLALCGHADDAEPVYLDVPEANVPALRLAQKYGMREVFGTARMYTGEPPPIPLDHVYGVTTFELG